MLEGALGLWVRSIARMRLLWLGSYALLSLRMLLSLKECYERSTKAPDIRLL